MTGTMQPWLIAIWVAGPILGLAGLLWQVFGGRPRLRVEVREEAAGRLAVRVVNNGRSDCEVTRISFRWRRLSSTAGLVPSQRTICEDLRCPQLPRTVMSNHSFSCVLTLSPDQLARIASGDYCAIEVESVRGRKARTRIR